MSTLLTSLRCGITTAGNGIGWWHLPEYVLNCVFSCPQFVLDTLLDTADNEIEQEGVLATKLCTHKDDVLDINSKKLNALIGWFIILDHHQTPLMLLVMIMLYYIVQSLHAVVVCSVRSVG